MTDAFLAGGFASIISLIGVLYSSRAARNTKPVSNGFAASVLNSLNRIENRLDQHLRDHSKD